MTRAERRSLHRDRALLAWVIGMSYAREMVKPVILFAFIADWCYRVEFFGQMIEFFHGMGL